MTVVTAVAAFHSRVRGQAMRVAPQPLVKWRQGGTPGGVRPHLEAVVEVAEP